MLSFNCIICNQKFDYELGDSSNLKKHLNHHKELYEWVELYDEANGKHDIKHLSSEKVYLVGYFITSDCALNELENEFLRKIVKIDLPCSTTFRNVILPNAYLCIKNLVEERLSAAIFVSLSIDLWTDKGNRSFNYG